MAYDRELAARLRELLAGQSAVSEQAMFGGLGFLVHGHLAVAAGSQGEMMLRVDPADLESLLADPAAEPFEMRGRAMKGWLNVRVDPAMSDATLAGWVQHGLAYVSALPPKSRAAAPVDRSADRGPAGLDR